MLMQTVTVANHFQVSPHAAIGPVTSMPHGMSRVGRLGVRRRHP